MKTTATTTKASAARQDRHEGHCGMCGKTVYVEQEAFQFAKEVIEVGLDNPIKCDVCQEAYDEACLRRLANLSKRLSTHQSSRRGAYFR